MLVLGRRTGERIQIGQGIEIVVLGVRHGRVRLGIVAPAEVSIQREEVMHRIAAEEVRHSVQKQ